MKWFALLGLLLFLGIAVAPSITAEMNEPEIISDEKKQFENLIELVDSIVSHYESKYGPLPDEDCECKEPVTTEWKYWGICLLLLPFVRWSMYFYWWTNNPVLLNFFGPIGNRLGCWWY